MLLPPKSYFTIQTDTQETIMRAGTPSRHFAGTSHGGGECEALRLLLGWPCEKYMIMQEVRVGLVGLDGGRAAGLVWTSM
ncbi:uncharacterized protein N7500_010422 [Penicillium coprophilum]|uniref:uncharacterized protein n=1 Tax=Penicillium coprophilum TaxID=36646 RepID=UPI0023A2B807|nr:uncharacterized protein N7500_010422 [Penicillium coprophilum]KAJ5154983.1 hypothetical protein N7500_010422 [Penicillium coprophilum]